MPFRVGLTGNIASGKSTVARLFSDWGATVIDADRLVHQLERPGTPVFAAIVERFGPGVVDPTGALDRAALRQVVFGNPVLRADLNAIVHPAVARERDRAFAAAATAGARIVVEDIPLLFETMDPSRFDAVVLVDAPDPVRRDRLIRDRKLDRATADAMIAAQMPAAEKRGRSTFVIDNTDSLAALHEAARSVWAAIERQAPDHA